MATQDIRTDVRRLVIAVPGTTETTETADPRVQVGMLTQATMFLPADKFDILFLNYAALYGEGTSYRESRDEGILKLQELLVKFERDAWEGDEIYLLGYSQGAAIVTLAVKGMRTAYLENPEDNTVVPSILNRIKGIYFLANPHRQPGMIIGPDPGGEGIAFSEEDGWWGELKDRVMEVTAPGDIIGSSDPNTTFLKRLPGYTIDMNWADLIGWAESVYHMMIKTNPLTLYPELRKEFGILTYLSRYFNTVLALYNYIASNVHVKYHTYRVIGEDTGPVIFAHDILEKASVSHVD